MLPSCGLKKAADDDDVGGISHFYGLAQTTSIMNAINYKKRPFNVSLRPQLARKA